MNKTDNKYIDRIQYERKLWREGFRRVMGLDEVGRGCLSGPVVAGGVIFEPGTYIEEIRDSKALSLEQRKELAKVIKESAAYWTIQWCTPSEIDVLNILQASIKAMNKCSEAEGARPDYLLIDGNRFSPGLCPHKCIVKGDDLSMSIAAASIIAKVYRDEWMIRLHEQYPHYGWKTNVGYPTKEHFQGLQEYGMTQEHRQSFKLRTTKRFQEEQEENQR